MVRSGNTEMTIADDIPCDCRDGHRSKPSQRLLFDGHYGALHCQRQAMGMLLPPERDGVGDRTVVHVG